MGEMAHVIGRQPSAARSSKVASLLLVRSVERDVKNSKSILTIKATPIAIGTGFWSPHDRTPGMASANFDLAQEE